MIRKQKAAAYGPAVIGVHGLFLLCKSLIFYRNVLDDTHYTSFPGVCQRNGHKFVRIGQTETDRRLQHGLSAVLWKIWPGEPGP